MAPRHRVCEAAAVARELVPNDSAGEAAMTYQGHPLYCLATAMMWHHEHGALRVHQDRRRDASQ